MFIIILNECVKIVAILAIGQNRALGVVGINTQRLGNVIK